MLSLSLRITKPTSSMLVNGLPAPKEKEAVREFRMPVFLKYKTEPLPEFKENKSRKITDYGNGNKFPERLIDLYNRSPKHNAIVTRKAKFINGKDTLIEGNEELKENWNRFDTLQEFKYKVILDKRIFGAKAIEVIYNNAGEPSYYHINAGKIRTLDHNSYQYWKDGSKTKPQDVKYYDPYDLNNKIIETEGPDKGKYRKQIIYLREYRADLGVYPLPDYVGGISCIDIDTRIPNYHLGNISNGFTGGHLIEFFKGEPTPEESRILDKKFKHRYQGDDAEEVGGTVLSFNEANEQGVKITPLNGNDLDEQFLQLNTHITQEIFVAHGVTSPMLFGVRVEGQLGGRNELAEAYEIYYRDAIEKEQEEMDRLIERLMKDMGKPGKCQTVKLEPINMDWADLFTKTLVSKEAAQEGMGLPVDEVPQLSDTQRLSEAINSLSPLVANKVLNELTKNEVRALAGLPPVEGGDGPSTQTSDIGFSLDKKELELWNDDDIKVFAKYGEAETAFEYLSFKFAKLSEKEIKVMSVINANEKSTVQDIADAIKIDVSEVEKILESLDSAKKINWTDNAIKITDKGRGDIGDINNIEIRWKYALAPDAPPLQPGGKSRPFCVKLMELNRLYTRADIDQMSRILGYDVWKRRGGWYHNPETDVNLPHCRHEFQQKVVRRKNA